MKKTEIISLPAETEKNNQLSPISFDELATVLGGKKAASKGTSTPRGSGGGIVCWC